MIYFNLWYRLIYAGPLKTQKSFQSERVIVRKLHHRNKTCHKKAKKKHRDCFWTFSPSYLSISGHADWRCRRLEGFLSLLFEDT